MIKFILKVLLWLFATMGGGFLLMSLIIIILDLTGTLSKGQPTTTFMLTIMCHGAAGVLLFFKIFRSAQADKGNAHLSRSYAALQNLLGGSILGLSALVAIWTVMGIRSFYYFPVWLFFLPPGIGLIIGLFFPVRPRISCYWLFFGLGTVGVLSLQTSILTVFFLFGGAFSIQLNSVSLESPDDFSRRDFYPLPQKTVSEILPRHVKNLNIKGLAGAMGCYYRWHCEADSEAFKCFEQKNGYDFKPNDPRASSFEQILAPEDNPAFTLPELYYFYQSGSHTFILYDPEARLLYGFYSSH